MARDIEDFLRRAAERRAKQNKKTQGGRQRPPQLQQREPLVISDNDVEIVKAKPARLVPEPEPIQSHVDRAMDTSDITGHAAEIARHAEDLGDRIQGIGEKTDARLHRQFDKKLGRLDTDVHAEVESAPEVSYDESSQLAQDLLKMLSSPKSFRQALLVSEILNRPTFDDDDE